MGIMIYEILLQKNCSMESQILIMVLFIKIYLMQM